MRALDRCCGLWIAWFAVACAGGSHGERNVVPAVTAARSPGPPAEVDFRRVFESSMAEHEYLRALNVAMAWHGYRPAELAAAIAVARASNALADLSDSPEESESHVARSIAALERAGGPSTGSASQSASSVEVEYFWAEAIGLKARGRGSSAVALLDDLAKHAEAANGLDPSFAEGSPQRLLGMLLVKAPSWPNGPGDGERGFKLLQNAVRAFPRRAEGHIHLADALLDLSRVQEAEGEMLKAKELLGDSPRAKKLWRELAQRLRNNKNVKIY